MTDESPSSRRRAVPSGIPGPGDVVAGKYLIERVLGVGGMGAVLAARHLELDEPVAIKMLLPHVPHHGEPVARFLREARAAIKIRNEHVVRVLDVARLEGGVPYIVMEYLEGCDLGQLVERRGPLPFDEALDYVLQACEAVGAAHAIGIVHRDLKPANLFVTRAGDGRPCLKVLDFGISKITEPNNTGNTPPVLTNTETIMGTPCFMSPEQLRSTRDVDARADIWSIGAILYAVLTGAPPYDGESNADVSAKIIRDPAPSLASVREDAPAGLTEVVTKCLQKDPAERYADVGELAQALAAIDMRDSAKASAARIVRLASVVAPTLSTTDRDLRRPTPAAASITPAGPTRTASSWGESSDEVRPATPSPSRRRLVAIGAGVLVAVVVGLVGAVRWWGHGGATAAGSANVPPPTASATAGAVNVAGPATTPATALSASSSPSASAAPGASAKPPTQPRASSSAAKPAPTSSKGGSNLFNGRN